MVGGYFRDTTPSEQMTSVAGTVSFQKLPFVMVFHCSTVPSKEIEVKLVQWLNADPMLVTLSGIVMEVKFSHPENVSSPIMVTLSEMVIEVKPEQPENA